MLVLLLQSRVFPDEDGVLPDGDETVSYGTGDDDWSAAFTAETETLLWGICYAALSDTMRETMSEKFDLELRGGGPPQGTPLLRHVNAKTTMLDPKAQDRAAKKEYHDHIATPMPEPLDTAGMEAWLDTAVTLNARRATPDDDHEIIEAAIQKFPADLVDKIEAKTEATKDAEEDLDIARACWATHGDGLPSRKVRVCRSQDERSFSACRTAVRRYLRPARAGSAAAITPSAPVMLHVLSASTQLGAHQRPACTTQHVRYR